MGSLGKLTYPRGFGGCYLRSRMRRFRPVVVAAFGAALILGSATLAWAQAEPLAGDAERKALYREGVDAAASGRWAEAKDLFNKVLAIRASPKVFFSLAQAEEQLGQ